MTLSNKVKTNFTIMLKIFKIPKKESTISLIITQKNLQN